jgi:hypothetical protein
MNKKKKGTIKSESLLHCGHFNTHFLVSSLEKQPYSNAITQNKLNAMSDE